MSETKTEAETKTSVADQNKKLQELEKELASLSKSLSRGATLTTLLTVVLLVVVGGYFVYGYTQFSALLEPKQIVDAVGGTLDDNIRPTRQTLQQEIIRVAPFWAESLSDQIVANLPRLTDQAEGYLLTQSKTALDRMEVASVDQFRRVVLEHRADFQKLAKELKNSEKPSEEEIAVIKDALQKEFGGGMKKDAEELLTSLKTLNDKLDRFSQGGSFSYDESIERQAMMLVRYMQTDQRLPELAIPSAPLQGLVDRLAADDESAEDKGSDDESDKKQSDADAKKKVGSSEPTETPNAVVASVHGSNKPVAAEPNAVAAEMLAVAKEAQALKKELLEAVQSADKATGEAREAADSAKTETAAAQAATAELREAIKLARESLDRLKSAQKPPEDDDKS